MKEQKDLNLNNKWIDTNLLIGRVLEFGNLGIYSTSTKISETEYQVHIGNYQVPDYNTIRVYFPLEILIPNVRYVFEFTVTRNKTSDLFSPADWCDNTGIEIQHTIINSTTDHYKISGIIRAEYNNIYNFLDIDTYPNNELLVSDLNFSIEWGGEL